MRYNANELYITRYGSVKFWPSYQDDELVVAVSGDFNIDGKNYYINRGRINPDATGLDDLFATDCYVYPRQKDEVYFKLHAVETDFHRAWTDATLKKIKQIIRQDIWAAMSEELNFRRAMILVYAREFIRDMDELTEFIAEIRTNLAVMEDVNDYLLIAQRYYDRVDPEEEDEDD